MAQFDNLMKSFHEAKDRLTNGLNEIRTEHQAELLENEGKITFDSLSMGSAIFSLHYCLSETIEQCERFIKEKPGRESALVKTKLQEALHWLNEVK